MKQLAVIAFFFYSSLLHAGNTDLSNPKYNSGLNGNGLCFTPNKGQLKRPCPEVLYKGEGNGADIYLRKTGISYVYSNTGEVMKKVNQKAEELELNGMLKGSSEKQKKKELLKNEVCRIQRLDMDFVGSNSNFITSTGDELNGYENYYYPQCPEGILNVKQCNKVTYKDIYENIDVCYYGGKTAGLKYDILVQSHGDPRMLKLKWTGAQKISISEDGGLVISTSVGELHEAIPMAYQIIDGNKIPVKAGYSLIANSNGKSLIADYEVSFKLGTYNPDYELIIDPWATYYGGTGEQYSTGTSTDNTGDVMITGFTTSVDFPVLPGAYTQAFGGDQNTFIVKFNAAGTRLWATYYGGSGEDKGLGIATDNSANICITGSTLSTDFPVSGGLLPAQQRGADGCLHC